MSNTYYLQTPLREEDVRKLKLNDIVYLSGITYTMIRDNHFTSIIDNIKSNKSIDMDLKNNTIYTTGTIFTRGENGEYNFKAIGATTSSKFNKFAPDFIKYTGIRAIIGKGGMDENTKQALKQYGCVYLSVVGGCTAVYTAGVEKLIHEYNCEKNWADNMLKIKLNNFGPLFVGMDANGNSIYENIQDNMKTIYK